MSESNLDKYLFHQGTNFASYDFLGCSVEMVEERYVYTFRTWAPNAISVGLISDFSGWDRELPFSRLDNSGVWELRYESDSSLELSAYKFRITSSKGTVNKGDPYARFSRGLDDGASLIYTSKSYKWGDRTWLSNRKKISEQRRGPTFPCL